MRAAPLALMLVLMPIARVVAQEAPPAPAAEAKPAPRAEAAPAKPAVRSAPKAPPVSAKRVAVVGVLDKRTGRSEFFTLEPGQRAVFGPLAVFLAQCETTPPWQRPKVSGAFVQVDETVSNGGQRGVRRVFSGWLFAESPSLNPMRHRVYDVWLRRCTMAFPDTPPAKPSPAVPSAAPKAKKSPEPAIALPSAAT